VLASIFKDAYTKEIIPKDTVSNLSKTKRGGINDYHEKYVEELEQVVEYMYSTHVKSKQTNYLIQRKCINSRHVSLLQIHSEYGERMKQAEMLERHILQARVRGAATESQARARLLEGVGEAYAQLGLPPGELKPRAMITKIVPECESWNWIIEPARHTGVDCSLSPCLSASLVVKRSYINVTSPSISQKSMQSCHVCISLHKV